MGFWSKVKKAVGVAVAVAPILPLPPKVKAGVAKVGEVEGEIEDAIREVNHCGSVLPMACE